MLENKYLLKLFSLINPIVGQLTKKNQQEELDGGKSGKDDREGGVPEDLAEVPLHTRKKRKTEGGV